MYDYIPPSAIVGSPLAHMQFQLVLLVNYLHNTNRTSIKPGLAGLMVAPTLVDYSSLPDILCNTFHVQKLRTKIPSIFTSLGPVH